MSEQRETPWRHLVEGLREQLREAGCRCNSELGSPAGPGTLRLVPGFTYEAGHIYCSRCDTSIRCPCGRCDA